MTFSDIVTVLGAGAALLLLLAMAAAPLLADLDPSPRRKSRPAPASFAPMIDIPAQRTPTRAEREGTDAAAGLAAGVVGERAAAIVRHAAIG